MCMTIECSAGKGAKRRAPDIGVLAFWEAQRFRSGLLVRLWKRAVRAQVER